MGGGQANKAQASGSYAGADRSAQLSTEIAKSNQQRSNAMYDMLYGTGTPMREFLSGKQLNEVDPQGVYKLGYQRAVQGGERELNNAMGQSVGEIQNRGFGIDAGAALDNARRLALGKAGMKGEAFSSAAGAQHNEALSNFWNAANVTGSGANASTNAALTGAGNAGQTYTNIYGTAGQYHQGAAAGIIGSALGAAGQVGAAAMTGGASTAAKACPAEDSRITVLGDEDIPVQDLDDHCAVMQLGGEWSNAKKPTRAKAQCVKVIAKNGKHTIVSWSHSFSTPDGGYVLASECMGKRVKYQDVDVEIAKVEDAGVRTIFAMSVGGNHSYMCDGFWSLD